MISSSHDLFMMIQFIDTLDILYTYIYIYVNIR